MKHLLLMAVIAILAACSKPTAPAAVSTTDTLYVAGGGGVEYDTMQGSLWNGTLTGSFRADTTGKLYIGLVDVEIRYAPNTPYDSVTMVWNYHYTGHVLKNGTMTLTGITGVVRSGACKTYIYYMKK
jgi:hypothetical protein